MDSQTLALEMPTYVDGYAPRRQLVTYLSLGTLAVWAYNVIATAQAVVI
ncbi:MAG: hypothetical protein JHD02_06680 [Thermoleophilaceae bacterium]|nr:hypothetical protein [Thermoleophilaceae bacterium]